ncbi:MAG: 4'-phosphopantetheinyl transferase family protein [Solirubrobacterales bacterium]
MVAILAAGELHVWRADLDGAAGPGDSALSASERERAARFRFAADRVRWTRGRAILRELLGTYLERDPGSIEFELGPHGKPAALAASGLEFNLSHSAGTALYAFAIGNPVGIDVEVARRERDYLRLAKRTFGEDEHRRLRTLPPAEREPEFLRAWVRHEAALKCRGEPLGGRAAPEGLAILELDAGPGAAAAVASEREPDRVRSRVWPSAR